MKSGIEPRRVRRYAKSSVLVRAIDRLHDTFSAADRVVVSFSGGKDSTAVLKLAIQVARDRGKLPLDVMFVDEEAIPPDTVNYVQRVTDTEPVRMHWVALPVRHRNACSRLAPYWTCWHPEERHLWCREPPPHAITLDTLPSWKGTDAADVMPTLFGPEDGTVIGVLGRRAAESMTRRMLFMTRGGAQCFMSGRRAPPFQHYRTSDPIYDWEVEDVWLAPHLNGWDYNTAYDLMDRLGVSPSQQHVAPPFGEEPSRDLYMFAVLWPELWDRMQSRVPGADTAARYSRTPLYGGSGGQPHPGETWREMTFRYLSRWAPEQRAVITQNLQMAMQQHARWLHRAGVPARPLPDAEPDPVTFMSWQLLAKISVKGVLKQRTLRTMLSPSALKARSQINPNYPGTAAAEEEDSDRGFDQA